MQFSQVIGHKSLKEHLAQSIIQGRVAHAQLFLAKEGCGALPLALAYATMVNCTNPIEADSCGICNSCKKMAQFIHSDLHFTFPTISPAKQSKEFISEWRNALLSIPYMGYKQWLQNIKAENKQGNITADETRDIIRRLGLKQVEGKFKIQIIWGTEYLGLGGNILLKLLEEPPENTLLILIAEDSDKILPTILSRTQVIKIPNYTAFEISHALIELENCDASKASQIGSISSGNWNIALNLFEQADNDLLQLLKDFLNGCLKNKDRKEFLELIDKLSQSGRDPLKMFFEYFLMILEKSTVYKYTNEEPPVPGDAERIFIVKLAEKVDSQKINILMDELNKSHYYIERNGNPKLVLFNLYLWVRNCLG